MFNTINQFSVKFVLALLALTFSITGFSQVKAELDTTSIRIGEELKYSILVDADTSATVSFPEGQSFLPFEVIESYPIDTSYADAKYRLIKKYGLTHFDSGSYTIPQQRILISNAGFLTDSLLVEVREVEVDTTKQKMFDIKPAMEVPELGSDWLTYLIWSVFIILLLAAIVYLILRRKKKIEEAKKQLPPYEEALFALQTLDRSEMLKNNQIKEYYSSLTEIVKRYLDREVDEAALESTTEELITKLMLYKDSGHLDFDSKTIRQLEDILKRADLIKFAKMRTESGQAHSDREHIESIINETHEVIPEPSEEELLEDELYKEEALRKKKRKKIALIAGASVAAIVLVFAVLVASFGMDTIRDTIFGNTTKNLAEGEWIKSEYATPAVIVETPEVLVRLDSLEKASYGYNTGAEYFSFGNIADELYILVGVSKSEEQSEERLREVMEQKLRALESRGATNLVVKDEPFETEKGITGIRAFGEFNLRLAENKFKEGQSTYELLLFAKNGTVQEVLIVAEKDDLYAQQIKERILNSVELEVENK